MTFQVQTPNGGSDFLGFQNFSGTNIAKITAADASANALTITTGNSGTTAAMFDTNQNATMNYISAQNTFGFKNRIINGAMVIDQRNAGASVTPTDGAYTLDRYKVRVSHASKLTVQQNAGSVTPPVGFTNYIGITSSSAYSVTSTDYFVLVQDIEGFNTADLMFGSASAKTITLSFQVYSSLTGTFSGALRNSAFNRSYVFSYSIPVANTWTTISVTIAGDTTGTWLGATNGIGLDVSFNLGCGSTYSTTAGSWQASNYTAATGATSVVGTNGATFYITGVQLEKGSIATPFDYRDYGRELIMCQRYYERSYNIGTATGTPGTTSSLGTFPAAYAVYFVANFKVTKRVNPTVVGYSPYDGASGNYSVNNTSNIALSGTISNGTQGVILFTGSSPGNVSAYVHFTADSEL